MPLVALDKAECMTVRGDDTVMHSAWMERFNARNAHTHRQVQLAAWLVARTFATPIRLPIVNRVQEWGSLVWESR